MKKYTLLALGAVVLVVAAYTVGRFSGGSPAPTASTERAPDTARGPDTLRESPPPPTDGQKTVPPGNTVDVKPLPPKEAPQVVRNTDLVRQRLQPGKTYSTLLRGTIHSVGTDANWGIESVVGINYAFEAQIDREIVDNDGEVIVEVRHFRDVRSLKIDTDLKDFRLKLGDARYPVLLAVGSVWPEAAFVVARLDGMSSKPVLDLLKACGVDVASLTGAKSRVFKTFTQFDGLTGKSVKIVYWNKPDRTGIIQLVPVEGGMTESEQFLHEHSALLSDALIFPEKKQVGDSWKVEGKNFSNLIDPGLRAAVGGELELSRRADRTVDGKKVSVLMADAGRLELNSSDAKQGQLGWFEPRGEMLFSPEEQAIVKAEMTGKGLLEHVSRHHLLFKTEMKQSPEIAVVYSCRVIDTPVKETK
jgi:hypothetical protein